MLSLVAVGGVCYDIFCSAVSLKSVWFNYLYPHPHIKSSYKVFRPSVPLSHIFFARYDETDLQ